MNNRVIYLIRHSGPFVNIENYKDYKTVPWRDYTRNTLLSAEGERRASKIAELAEMRNVKKVYSCDSVRAIATAKYIAEANNLSIILDSRLDERKLGITSIGEIPDNFLKKSLENKNFKTPVGESLNEIDNRFNRFLDEKLKEIPDPFAVVLHGMTILSFLQNYCDFNYDGNNFNINFNNHSVLVGEYQTPEVFRITYNTYKDVINIERLSIDKVNSSDEYYG